MSSATLTPRDRSSCACCTTRGRSTSSACRASPCPAALPRPACPLDCRSAGLPGVKRPCCDWRALSSAPLRGIRAVRSAQASRCCCDPYDGQLLDRQIDERCDEGECHVRVPHPAVVSEAYQRDAPEPGTKKTADLVRKKREAEECREVTHAEELTDEARGRRHRGQPGEAEHRGKHIESQRRPGRDEVDGDGKRAAEINPEEQQLHAVRSAQPPDDETPGHVRKPDDGKRARRDAGRQRTKAHLARQVRDEEGDVKAAGEKTRVQAPVT